MKLTKAVVYIGVFENYTPLKYCEGSLKIIYSYLLVGMHVMAC